MLQKSFVSTVKIHWQHDCLMIFYRPKQSGVAFTLSEKHRYI